MTIEDKIKDEKLQYDNNREALKISALSSEKIDKYEYLTGEKMLIFNQEQMIEQTKFIYSPLVKSFEKQTKTIEDLDLANGGTIDDFTADNGTNLLQIKQNTTGKTGDYRTKKVKIMVPLKHLSNFWRTREMLLIN